MYLNSYVKEVIMKSKVVFSDGIPKCPACGSYKFLATFELIGANQWQVESIYCWTCDTEIEITEELDKFLRGEKWTVKVD